MTVLVVVAFLARVSFLFLPRYRLCSLFINCEDFGTFESAIDHELLGGPSAQETVNDINVSTTHDLPELTELQCKVSLTIFSY